LDLDAKEYTKLVVGDPNMSPDSIENRHCILDIKLHTVSGKAIDIEIQVQFKKSIWKRVKYYNAMMLAEQAVSGGNYKDIPQAISILAI
jgi:predicted transposase/invertase (TIGR01784 family)